MRNRVASWILHVFVTAPQALALDTPLLMNQYISGESANSHPRLNRPSRQHQHYAFGHPGGWKYINPKTGEFFRGMEDLREKLKIILRNADIEVVMCA